MRKVNGLGVLFATLSAVLTISATSAEARRVLPRGIPPIVCTSGAPCHYKIRRVAYRRQFRDPLGWCKEKFPKYKKDLYIKRTFGVAFCTLPYDPRKLT